MALGFIVSPAKKMNVVEGPPYPVGTPQLLQRTEVLLDTLRQLSYEQVRDLWKCSDRLAQLNYERLQGADLTHGLTAACLAYEGIQYQHLAPQVASDDVLAYLDAHLRILSGFYGVVRPSDGVVPYRLEMQAKLTVPAHENLPATHDLYSFWGADLARILADEFDCVVNVASVEYAKAVTPYLATWGTPMVTCLFGTVRPSDGKLIQRSTEAKAARGTFVRWCAENSVDDPEGLVGFSHGSQQHQCLSARFPEGSFNF